MIQNSIESLTIVLELQSRKNVIQLEQIYILDYINCILLDYIKIAHFQHFSSAVNNVGVPKHTPLFETTGTVSKKPSEHSIPITPHHHTSILYSHPLVKLLTHSTNPNCILRLLIIPEPFPHLRLFVVTLTDLNPYTVLSIHPPPRPLPPPQCNQAFDNSPDLEDPAVVLELYLLDTVLLYSAKLLHGMNL